VIAGGCLCGAVRFEVERFVGPFELCHCSRCRKASGSAFVPGIGVRARDFRWVAGEDLVRRYEAPVREHPPGYSTAFCPNCGSPAPDLTHVTAEDGWFELVAGILDDDPMLRPDKHIFVDYIAAWDAIHDALPQLTKQELIKLRIAAYRANAKKRRVSE